MQIYPTDIAYSSHDARSATYQSLDQELSHLGRVIVDDLGDVQDELKTFKGKHRYTISLNTKDNTLTIYSRGNRPGAEPTPILVDSNGKIDHENSKVIAEHVKEFQKFVDQIDQIQSDAISADLEDKNTPQIEP